MTHSLTGDAIASKKVDSWVPGPNGQGANLPRTRQTVIEVPLYTPLTIQLFLNDNAAASNKL